MLRLRHAVLLLTVAGAGFAIWFFTRPRPVAVVVHTVQRGVVEATVANTRAGTVNANRRAKLAPPTGGQVEKLPVKEGQRVEQDQVLLELWNEDLRAQLLLTQRQAEQAAAQAEAAKLRAELAERDAERQLQLQERQVTTRELVDRAVSEAKAARAEQTAAEAEARVRQAQILTMQAQLDRTILRAPFAGVIAEVSCEIGEFVTPSPVGIPTPPAVDLIDDSSLYVTAPIDEVDAAEVRVGMQARITLDAFQKQVFAGHVRRIAPYVLDREKQARTVDVEVELVEPPADLVWLAGYSADVEILLEVREDVLRVPTEALREGGHVLVVADDGKLEDRVVQTGLGNWRFTEVTGGLRTGERVVVSLDREGAEPGAEAEIEPALPREGAP
jgi:HlyD family secretion protein